MPDLLIDADMYLYQAASACEVETDWGDDKWTLHSDAGEVRRLFEEVLQKFVAELGGTPILCFSDPTRRSFRHDICATYKQNRKSTRKPLAYAAVRDWFRDSSSYKVIIKPRLEADDVMGIVSTRAPGKFIIVSGDKDMNCVPGKLFYKGELREISEAEADRYHLMQTMTGDVTDGYPGVPGIGPVKAAEFVKHGWAGVLSAFKSKGLTEEDAILQARLARILRASDWDFANSEVILWSPNGKA